MNDAKKRPSALELALSYLTRGWSIIPIYGVWDGRCTCPKKKACNSPGKHTPLPSWKKYQTELPTEEEIRFWFGSKWPNANIGILTGPLSNLAVLDIDSQKGLDNLQALGYEIPRTPCVKTGGGSWHYYFGYPERGIQNSVKEIAGDVDVRGVGGLVVASGSNHVSGGTYGWLVSPDEAELAEVPAWMYVAKKDRPSKAGPTDRVSPEDWEQPVPQGSRNDTAARLAGSAAREGQPEPVVAGLMRAWNLKWCKPPMDDNELTRTVASIYTEERGRRDLVRSGIDQMIAHLDTLEKGAMLGYAEKELIPRLAELPPLDQQAYIKAIAKNLGVTTKDVRMQLRPQSVRQTAEKAVDEETLKLGREFIEGLGDQVLERVEEEVGKAGLAGEGTNATLLYLAITSRLLDKPVSIVVKGTSSSGKSYTVGVVLRLFPKSAYMERTGLSPKALAYTNEDFRHRTLVLFEVEGLSEDGDYLLRSLLSEGRIAYETVESTPQGLFPRLIVKEGPTNCIITTTKPFLHPENETRLLGLVANDSPEQTRKVLERMVTPEAECDYTAWHAAQQWLRQTTPTVVLPFAPALARKTAPTAPRMRRDFRALLSLLRTHALLCQAARERDPDGRIIATVDKDYTVIRELVADVVAQGTRATVKPEVRETVETVAYLLSQGEKPVERKGSRVTLVLAEELMAKIANSGDDSGVSLSHLSAALKLDRSSISRRVKEALELDYLVNLETRHGRPARLHIGEPMPEDGSVFPLPKELL